MNLRELVDTYRQNSGGFGNPVPLASFGLGPEETIRLFSMLDEDYHISRFLHFTLEPGADKLPEGVFQINGFPQSHVSLDQEIESIL
jgi:hypothetical protein